MMRKKFTNLLDEKDDSKFNERLNSLIDEIKGKNTNNAQDGVSATAEKIEVKDRKERVRSILLMKNNHNYSFEIDNPRIIGNGALQQSLNAHLDSILQEYDGDEEKFETQVNMMADRAVKIDNTIDEIDNLSKDDEAKLINLLDEKDDSKFNERLNSLIDEIKGKPQEALGQDFEQFKNQPESIKERASIIEEKLGNVDELVENGAPPEGAGKKFNTELEEIPAAITKTAHETRKAKKTKAHKFIIDFMKENNDYSIVNDSTSFSFFKKNCFKATKEGINNWFKSYFHKELKITNSALKDALNERLEYILEKYGDNEKEFKARAQRVIDRAKEIDNTIGGIDNLSGDDEKKLINLLNTTKTGKKFDSRFEKSLTSLINEIKGKNNK